MAEPTCTVFTFKEGVLSAVAHDLRIRVTKMEFLPKDASAVEATFDASSLRVECAMADGRDNPGALSPHDKSTIEETIVKEVLDARRHPTIRFVSTEVAPDGDGYRVRGELTLHGVTRPLSFRASREGSRLVAEVTLHQPDFGIKPYKALLGALKLKPDVRVRVEIDAP